MSTSAILRVRRDTAADWTSNNPTLEDGQLGFETDTKRFKLGDGATAWTSLAYVLPYVTATDKLLGRSSSGAGSAEEIACTAAARTVLDDATVAAMVDTLGGASSTGSGGLVRATSPTLVTPALGTPASGMLTNCNGLPASGVSGTALVRGNNLSDVANAATSRSNLGFGTFLLHTIYPWHHRGDAAMTLTDPAAGDAFLGKSNGNVAQFDATHYTHMRMTCRVTAAGNAGMKIVARYRTAAAGYSATIGDYSDIGTSAIEISLDSTGIVASSWIALAAGAKTDILLCPVQSGGNGATDPQIRLFSWEFKRQ